MRNTLIIGSAVIGLLAGPAFAQGDATPAQSPAVHPKGEYRGGVGSPSSTRASNITRSDTHSEIAPRLPTPETASSSPDALLKAAQQALSQGRTGAAQQALEMAETRVLTRTVVPNAANSPDSGSLVQHISAARQALGQRDIAKAKEEVNMAMGMPVPPPGPATTVQ